MVTCRGRLAKKVGSLTAAHVAAIDGNRFHIHTGDKVACSKPESSPPCEYRVLAADPVMDAALVEDGTAQTHDQVVRAFPYAGYLPLEIASPAGRVPARVIEMAIPQGVVIGNPGETPRSPALLLSDIPGCPGWSGSMVYQTVYIESTTAEVRRRIHTACSLGIGSCLQANWADFTCCASTRLFGASSC